LVQLRDTESQFSALGVQIIAISPDQPAKVRETIQKHNIKFHMLSDSQMAAARAFRIAYKVDEATLRSLAQNGIDLEAASGEKHHQLPVPAVFLVATNGVIQFEYVNPDYTVRADPDLVLAAARLAQKQFAASRHS
jgi:peroxiredoxin